MDFINACLRTHHHASQTTSNVGLTDRITFTSQCVFTLCISMCFASLIPAMFCGLLQSPSKLICTLRCGDRGDNEGCILIPGLRAGVQTAPVNYLNRGCWDIHTEGSAVGWSANKLNLAQLLLLQRPTQPLTPWHWSIVHGSVPLRCKTFFYVTAVSQIKSPLWYKYKLMSCNISIVILYANSLLFKLHYCCPMAVAVARTTTYYCMAQSKKKKNSMTCKNNYKS